MVTYTLISYVYYAEIGSVFEVRFMLRGHGITGLIGSMESLAKYRMIARRMNRSEDCIEEL